MPTMPQPVPSSRTRRLGALRRLRMSVKGPEGESSVAVLQEMVMPASLEISVTVRFGSGGKM